MLIVLSGLPGSGKSVIGYGVGRALDAPVLSVDPVEAAMVKAGVDPAEPIGLAAYVVIESIARDLLELGQTVVVDAVNAVEPARRMWRDLATATGTELVIIEVVCSDPRLHEARLAARDRGERAFQEPSWEDVQRRRAEYEPWLEPRLVIDTADDPDSVVDRALAHLSAHLSARPIATPTLT